MAERLTDAEIIKALTDCVEGLCDCRDCPFNRMHRDEFENCVDVALEQALSLINRQKAEIEMLDGAAKLWHTMMQKEIFRQDIIRADAIKEVFEKLEERLFVHSFKTKSDDYTQGQVDCMDFVDSRIEELKKELVGDSDG